MANAATNLYYTDHLQQHHQPPPPPGPQPPPGPHCPGVWSHPEYRLLRDKYDATLEQLSNANARIASLVTTPGGTPGKAGPSAIPLNHGNSLLRASTAPQHGFPGPPAQPDPSTIQRYQSQVAGWIRPGFHPTQLAHVDNYSKENASTTALQTHLPDLNGIMPTDADWKAICKDRKTVAADLLDKERTWTAQDEDMVRLCVAWMERRHERLTLCDESSWKAVNVLKARFEEARKPVTAGTRKHKNGANGEDGDDDGKGKGKKKMRLGEDITV